MELAKSNFKFHRWLPAPFPLSDYLAPGWIGALNRSCHFAGGFAEFEMDFDPTWLSHSRVSEGQWLLFSFGAIRMK